MKWTAKARVHGLTSRVPMGHRVNFLFQRWITRSYPRSDRRLAEVVGRGREHAVELERAGVTLSEATCFEFGAGWDLAVPLTLAAMGVRRQVVVDLNPLVREALVADAARRIAGSHEELRLPAPRPEHSLDRGAVLASRGIEYRAPCDARRTGLPAGSVDVITSTSTLEHIPRDDLAAILQENVRILRPGGVVSFEVDYSDHYSHGDPGISPYNFLGFSDEEWRRYNPRLHFQNRMRHPDYLELFDGCGLELVDVRAHGPDDQWRGALRTLPLAPRFRSYGEEDLAVLEGWFLLRKPA